MAAEYNMHEVEQEHLTKWQKKLNLVAKLFDVPAALIMRVHSKQIEVLVSSQSDDNPYRAGDRENLKSGLYCETVIATQAQLAVPNALQDHEWQNNPDVKLGMISYFGIPLIWPDGEVFGTICVLDEKTRHFSELYQSLLWEFKELIETDFSQIVDFQDRIHTSEQRYKTLHENLPVGVFRTKADGILVSANPALKLMFGFQNDIDIRGLSTKDFYHDLSDRDRLINDLGTQRMISKRELRLKRNDGSCFWGEINAIQIQDEYGNYSYIDGIVTDITERKQYEEKVSKSEKRLRLALESTNTGFYEWHPQSNNVWFSPTWFTIAGYSPDEFEHSYQTWANLLHPEDRQEAEEVIRGFVESRQPSFRIEYRRAAKNGGYCWILDHCAAVDWDNGKITRAMGTNTNISERKEVENRLIEREKRLSAVFEQTFQFMGLLSMEGKILAINRKALLFAGIDEASVVGDLFWDTAWWQHSKDEQETVKKAIVKAANGEAVRFEGTNRNHRGDICNVDVSIKPIYNDNGEEIFLTVEGRDITEKLAADKERISLGKQLQQAQRMEAIGTLAGGIAHDFNNILAAIIGYSELAKDDIKEDDHVRFSIEHVLKAAVRAKDLVRQILLFSRQSEQEMKPVRISLLAKEVIKLLRASLPSTIQIKMNLSAENDLVLSDPTQIHQVFMNLCTNAAHAMRENGGVLTIDLHQVELDRESLLELPGLKPGLHLRLQISDTGHGISDEIIDKVFDPFFSTKKRDEGTGLGLAVVHGIVKSHGGVIKIYSEVGEGTSIQVFLPSIVSEEHAEIDKNRVLPTGNEHVLFVDDERSLAEIGQKQLERLGYRVTAMTDSLAAWKIFESDKEHFDIVITDKTMPNMTGLELAEKVIAVSPETPVILCTGFSDDMTSEQAEIIGIKSLLYKPVIHKELADAIREALDQTA